MNSLKRYFASRKLRKMIIRDYKSRICRDRLVSGVEMKTAGNILTEQDKQRVYNAVNETFYKKDVLMVVANKDEYNRVSEINKKKKCDDIHMRRVFTVEEFLARIREMKKAKSSYGTMFFFESMTNQLLIHPSVKYSDFCKIRDSIRRTRFYIIGAVTIYK